MYVIRWSTSLRGRSQSHNTTAHLSENPWTGLGRSSPVNFYKPPRALSHFSWANHRRWRGQRARLDVLQLPMGNVSRSHRGGITNSLLSVLTSDGGRSSTLTSPAVHRELCMRKKSLPLYLGNLSHLALEDVFWQEYLKYFIARLW